MTDNSGLDLLRAAGKNHTEKVHKISPEDGYLMEREQALIKRDSLQKGATKTETKFDNLMLPGYNGVGATTRPYHNEASNVDRVATDKGVESRISSFGSQETIHRHTTKGGGGDRTSAKPFYTRSLSVRRNGQQSTASMRTSKRRFSGVKKADLSYYLANLKVLPLVRVRQLFGIFIGLYGLLFAILLGLQTQLEETKGLYLTLIALEMVIVFCLFVFLMLKLREIGMLRYFAEPKNNADIILMSLIVAFFAIDCMEDSFREVTLRKVRSFGHVIKTLLLIRMFDNYEEFYELEVIRIHTMGEFTTHLESVLVVFRHFLRRVHNHEFKRRVERSIELVSSNKLHRVDIDRAPRTRRESVSSLRSGHGGGGNTLAADVQSLIAEYENSEGDRYRKNRTLSNPASNPMTRGFTLNFASIPDVVKRVFSKLDEYDFNIFDLTDTCPGEELSLMLCHIFSQNGLLSSLNIRGSIFSAFSRALQEGYHLDNSYHTATHAADVLQTMYFFIYTADFDKIGSLSDLDIAGMLVAAAIHDYDHPGTNNIYHTTTRSNIAIRYNDISVLENHHVASVFNLMKSESLDIFSSFGQKRFTTIRKTIIKMVLSTDMAKHFEELGRLNTRFVSEDFDLTSEEDKLLAKGVLLHAADISNPTKSWELCKPWAERIVEEFFSQGDLERQKGLKLGVMNDRYTVNLAGSQITFIDIIVMPTFDAITQFLEYLEFTLVNCEVNKGKWETLRYYYQAKLDELNGRARLKDTLNQNAEESTTIPILPKIKQESEATTDRDVKMRRESLVEESMKLLSKTSQNSSSSSVDAARRPSETSP